MIHHINRLKKKNHMIRCRKSICQNPIPIHDKKLSKLGIEGNFLNLIKNILKTPHLIVRNSKIRYRGRMSSLTTAFQPCTGISRQCNKTRKQTKKCTDWEGRHKIVFEEDMIIYVGNPKELTKKKTPRANK